MVNRIVLVFAYLLPASVMQAQSQPHKTIADKIIAVVGDRIILSSEIENSISDLTRQNISIPQNAACLVTEQAIISKLLMLQALKDSLPVTDEEIEAELDRRISPYLKQFDMEIEYKTVYRIRDEARGQLKEMMLAEAMKQKIIGHLKISPAEVKSFFDRIPKDSLPLVEPELEVGQIVFFPVASKDLEQYVIDELNNYKKQVENNKISFCRLETVTGKKEECGLVEINRNSPDRDPSFVSASFRLKDGEISVPVKSRFGYYLIQMVERKGDEAAVRYIFRPHPVTDVEITRAKSELNSLRSKITDGLIGFNEAALKYSDDSRVKFTGPYFLNQDGSTYITINHLETELADIVNKLNAGEISRPMFFTDHENKKGVRIIFLKSRSNPHILNMRDDYSKLANMALEEKRMQTLDKWIRTKIPTYHIMIDNAASTDCPEIQRFAVANK